MLLARREILDNQDKREISDKSDSPALRALLDCRDGLDRREIKVQLEEVGILEALVSLDRQDSVVRRVSRVLVAHKAALEIVVLMVSQAGLEVLEVLDLVARKAYKDNQESLDPLDKLDHLDLEVFPLHCLHLSVCLCVWLSDTGPASMGLFAGPFT